MRADDERAFTEFAQGRVLELRRTAYRLCGDWDQAHDLTQTALVRLYRHWAKVARADSPDAYVRRILVNAFLDQRQTWWSRKVRPVPEPPDTPAPADGLVDRLDLMAALARLAPGQRAVIVLRYWEGLDVAETARALGCSPGTVKSQTSYAIAALRRLLPNYIGGRA
ncbi:SigE family RNA polymerase sigma factor [Catellatospora bangladeshensis]|uniref:RNA polymerase sigma24 factor n=1 Tax=Catellatospora bangladeshensis TaxID=310355 RepID=A0A8J3NIN1_9ACTN|nr:SigE family RNA polymerase sigma factor [Catellatospora bangladeshensis]GIF82317.1 RNA polymerase sigma24 factor [Catellatospora bangladeshensis]